MTTNAKTKLTTLQIETVEQYDSAISLGHFLAKITSRKGYDLIKAVINNYGDDFSRCEFCDYPMFECGCRRDGYSAYDDEASFE